jgi:WD40 repeat protein
MRSSIHLLIMLLLAGTAGSALVPSVPPSQPKTQVGPESFVSIGDVRFGAVTSVRHAVFSSDGRWLAGTGRGQVQLWESSTGKPVRRILFGNTAVGCRVAFSPDGKTISVLAFDDIPYVNEPPYYRDWPVTVRRFDAITGRERDRVRLDQVNAYQAAPLMVADFTPDGSGLFIGGNDLKAGRYSTTTGRKEWGLDSKAFPGRLMAAHFSPDGTEVMVDGTSGHGMQCLDANTGALLKRFPMTTPNGDSVRYSPDGKFFATAARGNSVTIWDRATRTPIKTLTTGNLINPALAFSPTGDRLAVSEYDSGFRVYDVATGRETARFERVLRWPTLNFSPDGSSIVAAAGPVIVLDAATGQRRGLSGWSPIVAPQFQFTADGRQVHVRTSNKDDLITYELQTGRELKRVPFDPGIAASLGFSEDRAVSADGRLTAIQRVGGESHAISVTENVTGREQCQILEEQTKHLRQTPWFAPDNSTLVTVGTERVQTYDARTGQRVRELTEAPRLAGKLHAFLSVIPSPSGRYLAVAVDTSLRMSSACGTCNATAPDDESKTVSIWDTTSWKLSRKVDVSRGSWFFWQTDERFTVETVARRPIVRARRRLKSQIPTTQYTTTHIASTAPHP